MGLEGIGGRAMGGRVTGGRVGGREGGSALTFRPGGAGTPTHWHCAATLHFSCFPHSLPAH